MKESLRFLLLLFCSFSACAETITWFTFDRPPWFMENGKGYGDRMQARYTSLLPEYQHKSMVVNLARMSAEMKNERNFCVAALANLPAYRGYMHMSKTLYIAET